MKSIVYFILLVLLSISSSALNNIYEFDEKSDIIITTSLYKNGLPYDNATCNLTVFNPPPLETFINFSIYMDNKGNGIYSSNLTHIIGYNDEIYPITLHCYDGEGYVGYDDRIGIKIGAKLYDFIIGGIILIAIAFLFIYISFQIKDELGGMKLLFFYIGLAFVLSSLFYGLSTVNQLPHDGGMKIIFITLISIFMIIILLLIYLQFTDKLQNAVNTLLGSK